MKLETKFGIVLCLLCVIIIIFVWLILTTPLANATEPHAVVSFDDAEHLVALTDSVVGVCDTTWCDGMGFYNQYPRDTTWISGAVAHGILSITCRELVCMEVVAHIGPEKPIGSNKTPWDWKSTPGQAIIYYREEER